MRGLKGILTVLAAVLFAANGFADCSWTAPTSTSILYTSNCTKVGIGNTTNPQDTLHLRSSTGAFLRLEDSDFDGLVVLGMTDTLGPHLMSNTNSDNTASRTTGAHRMLFGYDGVHFDYSQDTTAGDPRSWSRTFSLNKWGWLTLTSSSAFATLTLEQDGPSNGRLHMATSNWIGMTLNTQFNGSAFVLDDTTNVGWVLKMEARDANDKLQVFRVPSGNYNHTDEVELLRLDNAGNLKVKGSLTANGLDVAEWVEASADLPVGTVVVLDPSEVNRVRPSGRAYDTTVAGVVAEKPGLILGEGSDTKEMIATTGRMKVRVDATKSPVKIGDLLVTAGKPGMAMVSKPVDLDGVSMHRPGTLIGKALEPLAGGEGEILVLLSMQ